MSNTLSPVLNPINTVVADVNSGFQDVWWLIPNWKWIALFSALALGVILLAVLRPTLQFFAKQVRQRLEGRSWGSFMMSEKIEIPLAWVVVCILWMGAWEALSLPDKMNKVMHTATQLVLSFFLIRLAYLGVSALGNVLLVYVRRTQNTLDDQLAPFITKTLKALVIILGILIMMQNFGINVVSILAGLGIGGLALAFAAQDTAANVFGSIMILTDRPFQIGDYIKIGDGIEGTVEDVGFRSTRLRTPGNTLLTIPNAVVAKEKIENLQVRPTRRIRHVIDFTYDAKREQLEHFVGRLRAIWEQHPTVQKDTTTVVFQALAASSLQVLAQAYIKVNDWNAEVKAQEELLHEVIRVAEELGLQFAFPTQTLHHVVPPAPPPSATPSAPRSTPT